MKLCNSRVELSYYTYSNLEVPDLLSYIQALVDENNTPGQFVVTGSHQRLDIHP